MGLGLSDIELLYLRKLVVEEISAVDRTLSRNVRFFSDTDDPVLFQRKIGRLESELKYMGILKDKINDAIALNALTDDGLLDA